ncbi:hypothetical protein OPQ81_008838 [Rhizoctonia solani]|nr:hypothetical protein OPQ81_008838 [Rhizoctonia solani]
MPYPELASPPSSPDGEHQPEQARDTLAEAWCYFRSLNIDWMVETEIFRMRTQRVTHIRLTQSSIYALLVLHILQETHPTVLQGIFPRLFALTIGNDHYAPLISQCVTKLPSLRHVTYEASNAALGLTSFTIQFISDSDNKEYFGRFLEPHWASPESVSTSLSRFPFILTRAWKHIELPGRLVGKCLFSALASIDTLESLTIHGPLKCSIGEVKYEGIPFSSLRKLRLLDVSTTSEGYFNSVVLQSVQYLELRYLPEREGVASNAGPPIVDLALMTRACPNASSILVTVNNNAEGEQFVRVFDDSDFEPLLAISSLEKLVVHVPPKGSVCLSDDFLDRAARSWPRLRELDMDPAHSSHTLVTLQGLAPLARHCPKLRSLQLGIQSDHIHTVFNAELYAQENENEPRVECPLVYLDIGCPSVYSAEAVADFFLALFPRLRHVECPKSLNSIPCSRGDYFVWSQVVRMVQERDRDLDNLARTLRARDLVEKQELAGGDFIVSSIDDSDEDYWAYSGSEDESYSSDED